MEQSEQFNVTINSPSEVIWKGTATSVSSKNSVGIFDVLAGHANFITMIQNEPIIVRSRDKERVFKYENAVLSVLGDVVIYVEV